MEMLMFEAEGLGRCHGWGTGRGRLTASFKVGGEDRLSFEFALGRFVEGATRFVAGTTDELVFEVFRTEDGDFGKQEFARNHTRFGIVQNGPDRDLSIGDMNMSIWKSVNGNQMTYKIFELPPGLFDDGILTAENDAHPTEVANLCPTDDQRVNVEATACQDTRHPRQDTRLILHETVENMPKDDDESHQKSMG